MSNKSETETITQQPKSFIKKLGRKFSSVSSKRLAVFVLVAGLSFAPTALMAASARQQNTPTATVQTQQQPSFTQEQNRKGAERMENMIQSLKNQIKTNNWDEKEPKKADYYRLLISTLEEIRKNNPDEMGLYADVINTANLKFSKYEIIVVNNKIEYCSNGYANVTKEYKTGMENIINEYDRLISPQNEDGSPKTADEIRSDNLAAKELKEKIVDENLIKDMLATSDNLSIKEKMTQTLRKTAATEQVEENVANAVENTSLGCKIVSFITPDSELVFEENGDKRTVRRYAEWENGRLVDKTDAMKAYVKSMEESQKIAKNNSPQL